MRPSAAVDAGEGRGAVADEEGHLAGRHAHPRDRGGRAGGQRGEVGVEGCGEGEDAGRLARGGVRSGGGEGAPRDRALGAGNADAAVAADLHHADAVRGGGNVDALVEGGDPLADAAGRHRGARRGKALDIDEEERRLWDGVRGDAERRLP